MIDDESGPLLDGACIDFSDTPQKQGFTIYNLNARGMCLRRLDSLASGHQPPLAWLCAQEDALALITASRQSPYPSLCGGQHATYLP